MMFSGTSKYVVLFYAHTYVCVYLYLYLYAQTHIQQYQSIGLRIGNQPLVKQVLERSMM